jgi:hypothetical protein
MLEKRMKAWCYFASPINYFGINLELELCQGNVYLSDRVRG